MSLQNGCSFCLYDGRIFAGGKPCTLGNPSFVCISCADISSAAANQSPGIRSGDIVKADLDIRYSNRKTSTVAVVTFFVNGKSEYHLNMQVLITCRSWVREALGCQPSKPTALCAVLVVSGVQGELLTVAPGRVSASSYCEALFVPLRPRMARFDRALGISASVSGSDLRPGARMLSVSTNHVHSQLVLLPCTVADH